MKVMAVGDIHGEFGLLNTFIDKEQPDVIFQCGDNAYYWSGDKDSNRGKIKPQNTKVYLVPGNHENWDITESVVGRHGKSPVEVEPNIFICFVGSTIEIKGKTILFVGGADSIDKANRIWKKSWWDQEILKYEDFKYIEENVKKADIVISHTCPEYFGHTNFAFTDKINDPSRQILNMVYDLFHPTLWCYGHWHSYREGKYENTNWIGLNMITDQDYFRYLVI